MISMVTKTGKVFTTKDYMTKCECGNINTQEYFLGTNEGKLNGKECFVSFCKCGNVFVSKPTTSMKPNRKSKGKLYPIEWGVSIEEMKHD